MIKVLAVTIGNFFVSFDECEEGVDELIGTNDVNKRLNFVSSSPTPVPQTRRTAHQQLKKG